MSEPVPFGGEAYATFLVLLLFSRAMDFLSTWLATPNLVLEANPIARRLGWRWGIPVNVALCFGFAWWPLPAIIISTTSVLVAARNFQGAWLMRSLGEENYRDWYVLQMQHANLPIYLFCLLGQTLLTGGVGAALMYFCGDSLVAFAVGFGIIGYALAVTFYTSLSLWRIRRGAR